MVFVHENNDFNPLIAYYCSFIVHLWMFIGFLTHLCCFFFRCVFSTNFYGPVDVCLLGVGNGNIGVGCGIWSTSMTLFWCLCCFLSTCFTLPPSVSVFDFGHVGVSGTLFVVNTLFYIFIVVLVFVNLEP